MSESKVLIIEPPENEKGDIASLASSLNKVSITTSRPLFHGANPQDFNDDRGYLVEEIVESQPPRQPIEPIDGVPLGLELLTEATEILIQQQIEVKEVLFGVETPNRYDMLDASKTRIYCAWETKVEAHGSSRAFKINISDYEARVVMEVERPFSRLSCIFKKINLCGTIDSQLTIYLTTDGTKNALGYIKQKYNCRGPRLKIYDENNIHILTIKGPKAAEICWGFTIKSEKIVEFPFCSAEEESITIGHIKKEWAGWAQESISDADNYRIVSKYELPVTYKALLISAVFLIDFMFFENDNRLPAI